MTVKLFFSLNWISTIYRRSYQLGYLLYKHQNNINESIDSDERRKSRAMDIYPLPVYFHMGTAPEYPPYMPIPAPGGNAAVPQRHEQEHWPLAMLPVPITIEPPAAIAGDEAGAAALI